ncbi:MAG: LarC family nickel insertion protein [Verrucomicrobia bacterium]|nr:LarC family nickel insertion protein [Verrucomicrobiota bacterium]
MSRTLYLESVSGVAGDMFAAAFVHAGLVSSAELAALPAKLGFAGVRVEVRPVIRAAMSATHLAVRGAPAGRSPEVPPPPAPDPGEEETHLIVDAPAGHTHTRHAEIDERIAGSDLPAGVRERARRIFRLLAEAEAAAHGTPLEEVAFHEVGSVDSIVDVVLAAWCLEQVKPDRICATPLRPGRGFVRMQHGHQPVPPPASARLLTDLPVAPTPAAITRANIELSTPTGIAIVKSLAPEFVREMPAGTVRAQGMGAGTLDFGEFPNVFRVTLLEADPSDAAPALPYETDQVVEVAANIDDDTGEHLAWITQRLLALGALDVWISPGTGKKGRPLHCLQFLAAEPDWARLADWFLRHSTSFGIRHRRWDRLKLARRFESRETPAGPLTFKIGLTTTGEVLKEKPEFEEQRRHWEREEQGG